MNYFFEDFTEDNFRRLFKAAREKYTFIAYDNIEITKDCVILLRHDVDFSMHRAYRLATIESELGISSTYFFHLHNTMYNLLEKEIADLGRKIINLGHRIGVHFDPSFQNLRFDKKGGAEIKKWLCYEKRILEKLFETKIHAFSIHNPDIGGWTAFENFDACGMINSYSKFLKDNYTYCSDSNGYWRYKRLEDVLSGGEKRLHILLHPAWWTPSVMSPHERVIRCIDGRKEKNISIYNDLLKTYNRENIM